MVLLEIVEIAINSYMYVIEGHFEDHSCTGQRQRSLLQCSCCHLHCTLALFCDTLLVSPFVSFNKFPVYNGPEQTRKTYNKESSVILKGQNITLF